jgi:hypothetical protein
MPDNPTRPVDLSWFYTLDPKDRVEVLARTQSPQLADQLKSILRGRSPLDDGDVVARLDEIRYELNFWWQEDRLTDHLRDALIVHRADDTYRDLMQFEAAAIGVELAMIRTYLDLQDRQPGYATVLLLVPVSSGAGRSPPYLSVSNLSVSTGQPIASIRRATRSRSSADGSSSVIRVMATPISATSMFNPPRAARSIATAATSSSDNRRRSSASSGM